MSPAQMTKIVEAISFPRVSGDEPIMINRYMPATKFSPRERG